MERNGAAVVKEEGRMERVWINRVCGVHASVVVPQKRKTQQPILVAVVGTSEKDLMIIV